MKRVSKQWQTFLRLTPPNLADTVAPVDENWLASRAIYPFAPQLWQLLRDEVLPLVRRFERDAALSWYFFLIHDVTSGVPGKAGDQSQYIDLQLMFHRPVRLENFADSKWEMTKPIEYGDSFGGVDNNLLVGKSAMSARQLICYQSEWVLRLVDMHERDADIVGVMQHARQYLHLFSNMLQIKVVG